MKMKNGNLLLIDTHDREVSDPVWALYEYVLGEAGGVPTLIEWDTNVPDWQTLFAEAKAADRLLDLAGEQPAKEQVDELVS